MRFWQVYITTNVREGEVTFKGRRNRCVGVVAPSLQAAVAHVEETYKDDQLEIWTAQHRGEVHHVVVEDKWGFAHVENEGKGGGRGWP